MKFKYLMTIPLGYLFLSYARDFSLIIFRYNIPTPLDNIIYVCLDILVVFFFVFLYNKYILKEQLSDIYVCRPAPRLKWVAAAILLSTIVLCCCLFLTEGTLVKENLSAEETVEVVSTTILSGGVRAAVTEEVIFRGFIFNSLRKMKGPKTAVMVSSILFAVMHLVNINIFSIYNVISLLIAISIIGCAFALIVLETGSIWSGVAFHAIYNILSGDMDILHVSTNQMFPAVWSYTPVKEYRWITGIIGSDDIETGFPAMAGFIIVIIATLYSIKKKKRQVAR
ncbi:MAG: type II CAAX endopeptidase family protein [Eubacteriales bacterium]|nr:type II CAAX endopeptidase family protein [Eubacteriales bacterium]